MAVKHTNLSLSAASRESLASVVSQVNRVLLETPGHKVPLVRPASLEQPGSQDHPVHLVHLDSPAVQVLLARQALLDQLETQERG